jgi:hypothetical protein
VKWNKHKIRDNICWFVIWIYRSKFSSFHYFWHEGYLSISALLFSEKPDIFIIVSKNKIEVPHGKISKRSFVIEKCKIVFW